MDYIIDDRYKIKPSSNGLCYELWEYREVVSKKTGENKGVQWVHTGKYPTSLSHGLRLIFEIEMKRGQGTIRGLKAAIKHAEEIENRIMKGVQHD